MAENERDDAKDPLLRTPNVKRRREPAMIDAKATDLSDPDIGPDHDLGDRSQRGNPDYVQSVPPAETIDEPVLFGRAVRAASPPQPQEVPNDGLDSPVSPRTPDSMSAAATEVAQSDPAVSDADAQRGLGASGAPPGDTEGGGIFGGMPTPSRPEPIPSTPITSAPRSRAAMILGLVAVILLFVIAGLLVTEPKRVGTDELRAALDTANGRLDALDARADPGAIEVRFSELDKRSGALGADLASVKTSVEELAGRLDQLSARLDDNAAKLNGQPAASVDASQRGAPDAAAPVIAGASANPDAAPSAGAAPGEITALAGRVDALSERLDALPSPAPAVDLAPVQGIVADLGRRLDALDASVKSLPKVDLAPVDRQVQDLDHRLADMQRSLAVLSGSVASIPKVDIEPLKAAVAAADQRIAPLEAALAAPKSGERVTESRAVGNADVSRAAPLAVVAQEASRGIDDGRPIVAEVDALRALGIDDATLSPLAAVAENGAPTLAALKDAWTAAEPKVNEALRPAGGDESLLGRFAAGARRIVSVRRVGAPIGKSSGSIPGRVSAALEAGDVATALAEWQSLPEAGQGASQRWAEMAGQRLDAQAAAKALASGAIETLAKARG